MSKNKSVSYSVAVADPDYPARVIKPNADGSINVNTAGGTPGAANISQVGGVAVPASYLPVNATPTTLAAAAIAPSANAALASSKVLKASAGNLYGLTLGATTVAGYFLLFNATALPVDGAVTPVKCWPVTTGQGLELSFSPPLRMGTGITVAFSSNTTTPFTLAASATAFIDGEYV